MYANCMLVFPSSCANNTGIQRELRCINEPNLEADGSKMTHQPSIRKELILSHVQLQEFDRKLKRSIEATVFLPKPT